MIIIWSKKRLGFPGSSDGRESACNAGDLDSIHRLGRFPGKEMATNSTLVFLLGELHGFGSLASYNPWGRQEVDLTEWLTLALSSKKRLEQHFEKLT